LALVVAAVLLAGCDVSTSGTPIATTPPNTLTVLAGSELKDLAPLMPQIERDTGVHLAFSYIGSLDGASQIASGSTADLGWFSSGKYLTLLQGTTRRVIAQSPIMLSPVILGVKHSTAQQLGWSGSANVTWRNMAEQAKAGQFHFAMTDPTSSNSGFVALVGVASAFANSGSALQVSDITANAPALTDFFSGQALTAGSSGFLADSYVRSQDTLDGIVNYESVLLSLNSGGKLHQPLDLIYPKEGIITADYPLMLLNANKRGQYDKLVAYLRTPSVQKQIMDTTGRRPAVPEVPLASRFTSQVLVELPFPSGLQVINTLLLTYQNQIRIPSHPIFVLDMSGSMFGDRINGLKQALRGLTGLDTSLTGQFSRFRAREQITIITFSDHVLDTRDFNIQNPDPNGPDLTAVRAYIDSLQAGGGTAIYDALAEAYAVAGRDKAQDPNRYYSIVLMTDGENNAGRSAQTFLNDYGRFPTDQKAVKTFTVLFGEASPAELQRIASTTGGTVFDARSAPLNTIFKEIRGYQ
jgi:Ca-activated chloride channel homolog